MEDQSILELYFQRSEQAIVETDRKYGGFCYHVAYNILTNREDAQESVSDTYLRTWNSIPPTRPKFLQAFLGKLTRNISIDRWRRSGAKKRGGGEMLLSLEELEDCIGQETAEKALSKKELVHTLNGFLQSLADTERNVFLCRYWYLDPIQKISEATGFSQNKINAMLHRTREKLRKALTQEGYL